MKNQTISKLPRILVEQGEKLRIAKLIGSNHVTVRESLKGNVNTPLGLRIRKLAITRGGVMQEQSLTK